MLYLLCLPVGYILFRQGASAYAILVTFVAADLLNRIIQFILLHFQLRFPVGNFLRHAYLRPLMISAVMVGYLFLYRNLEWTGFWGHAAGFMITLAVTALVILLVGFNKEERHKALSFLKSRGHKA